MKSLSSQVRMILIGVLVLVIAYELFMGGLFFLTWLLKHLLGAIVWLAIGVGLARLSRRWALIYFFISFAAMGVYLLWILLGSFFFWSKTLLLLMLCATALYVAWTSLQRFRDSGR